MIKNSNFNLYQQFDQEEDDNPSFLLKNIEILETVFLSDDYMI